MRVTEAIRQCGGGGSICRYPSLLLLLELKKEQDRRGLVEENGGLECHETL